MPIFSEVVPMINKGFLESYSNQCENNSLYFSKLAYGKTSSEKEDKNKLVNSIFDILNRVSKNKNSSFISGILKDIKLRRDRMVKNFNQNKGYEVIDKYYVTDSKLLVGAGSPSPVDVGFYFCRNYGLPVIPASSIKGCFAHYYMEEEIDDEQFRKIFGFSKQNDNDDIDDSKGGIIFLDAIPEDDIKYQIDIINNHFPEYYTGNKSPNDIYNPVPVKYITLGKGTKLRFTFLMNKEAIKNGMKEKIEKDFENMLKDCGVGAKTAYGYGRFK